MGFELSEIQQLIRRNARDFAREFIRPGHKKSGGNSYSLECIRKMAKNDLLGIFLPEDFGGSAAGYLSYILVVEEVAKVNAGIAAILVNHASLVGYAVDKWGSADQKKYYLPAMCKGEKLGAFALTEPGAAPGMGPDRVIAVRKGESFVLNGLKCYVPNGGIAQIYIVFALTDPDLGINGMSAFVVDAKAKGFSVVRSIRKMGMQDCPMAELLFQDVTLSAKDLLGREGEGISIIQKARAVATIAEGALIIGVAQAAMEEAADYALQRQQFGKPIASFPAVQNMLAEIATNIHLARLAVFDAANSFDKGEEINTRAAMIKLFVSRIGTDALIDAVQIEGGYGYSEDVKISRYYRDVKGAFLRDSSLDFPEQEIAAALLARNG